MSRVHCVDCGIGVIVDPTGLCPEGHLVGAVGARVATSIGRHDAHPDEPEPWIGNVELGVVDPVEPPSRDIRPPSIGGLEPEHVAPVGADNDALLRELHSLADLDLQAPPTTTDAPTVPDGQLPESPDGQPATPAAPPTARAETGDPEALADLSALQAALSALTEDAAPGGGEAAQHGGPPAPTTVSATPDGRADGLDELEALFVDGAPADRRDMPPLRLVPPDPEPDDVPGTIVQDAAQATPAPFQPTPAPAPASAQPQPGLDFTNFTAKGNKVGGKGAGKRRLFSR